MKVASSINFIVTIFFVFQLSEMNGKMIASKPLYVALAQRKEDRRARLQVSLFCASMYDET